MQRLLVERLRAYVFIRTEGRPNAVGCCGGRFDGRAQLVAHLAEDVDQKLVTLFVFLQHQGRVGRHGGLLVGLHFGVRASVVLLQQSCGELEFRFVHGLDDVVYPAVELSVAGGTEVRSISADSNDLRQSLKFLFHVV